VRHAEVDGCLILLDLNTESYRVLDPVASAMWSALIGEGDWAVTRQLLADTYDVSPEVLNNDFADFAANCRSQGILGETQSISDEELSAVESSDARQALLPGSISSLLPTTIRAILILYQTRRSLMQQGFRGTYERYARLPGGSNCERLPRAISAFGRAETFFLAQRAPNDCLVRSLSLFRFLREQSIPAEHVIGVCRMPFQAHAWVECDGRPILDERGWSGAFVPLARLAATIPAELPR
jgi:hypothetical protein